MKTKILLFIFISTGQLLSAQTFIEILPTPPFDAITQGSIAFSDVDGDNDQDVLFTGLAGSVDNSIGIAKLYINDGLGNFIERMGTSFEGVGEATIAFSDVDGDNDQDVLIIGQTASVNMASKLYINDGLGNFVELIGTPFENVGKGSIAFSDIDGDNDQDVLITGQNDAGSNLSKLYTNNGLGSFTEVIGAPFDGVTASSIAFSDVDGDNDQDILITGLIDFNNSISKLYSNDGAGNYTEMMNTPFDPVFLSSVAFSDIDGDDDQDVLITGLIDFSTSISKLYSNDGIGNYTEMMNTPFDPLEVGSVAFSDIDGDNDQDVFITGFSNSSNLVISKLYTNDGLGNYTEMMNTPFDPLRIGSVAFSDIDGDDDQDLLITGRNSLDIRVSKLYRNEGMASSVEDLVNTLSFEFMLYPNPTKANIINVRYDSKSDGLVNVNIYDLEGKLLKRHQEYVRIGELNFSIDVSSFSKGSYIIQLEDGLRKGVRKFKIQ